MNKQKDHKDLLNWYEVARVIGLKPKSINKNRVPKKHQPLNELLELIKKWYEKYY